MFHLDREKIALPSSCISPVARYVLQANFHKKFDDCGGSECKHQIGFADVERGAPKTGSAHQWK
jgi:hypothetical protein